MYKIAILGCENSHANTFLDFIKEDAEFSDVEVIGVYSDDAQAANALSEKYGVNVMQNFAELSGKVDSIMVTARHGNNHLKFVEPYLEYGIPVFMDKPITIRPEEAISMVESFKKYKNRFSGGSCLKYNDTVKKLKNDAQSMAGGKTIGGLVRAPIMQYIEFGGFYFYAQHLVESICEIFGHFPKSVRAFGCENGITAVIRYDDYDVTAAFTENCYSYYAVRLAEENTVGEEIILDNSCFREEFLTFYKTLKGEGTFADASEFIAPVFIMNAIEKSIKEDKEIIIKYY